ncbi:MAG: hydroxymethylglutaryl-CoA lyase [Actinomycetota bacterium]|nr:hydroxymethylglutaryl-CoA lyase [Actinomycetota bacterium]
MRIAESVTITEVGPRDGLQSLGRIISTEDKVKMIELLLDGGIRSIEVTSFVRPEVIPELADAEQVMEAISRRPGVSYRALVPNKRGAERAASAGVDAIVGLITVSETYSRKNQNRSVQDLVRGVDEILHVGRASGRTVDIAVGMAFFCPYEGPIAESQVENLFSQLIDLGGERFYVATSVGMADPSHVHRLCTRLLKRWPQIDLGIHLHNTNGMALANALAAMDAGVRTFEGSICGIGGGIVMPHGLSVGNVATEDLVQMFHEMGVRTEIEIDRIVQTSKEIATLLGVEPSSFAARGGTKADVLEMGRSRPKEHPV